MFFIFWKFQVLRGQERKKENSSEEEWTWSIFKVKLTGLSTKPLNSMHKREMEVRSPPESRHFWSNILPNWVFPSTFFPSRDIIIICWTPFSFSFIILHAHFSFSCSVILWGVGFFIQVKGGVFCFLLLASIIFFFMDK